MRLAMYRMPSHRHAAITVVLRSFPAHVVWATVARMQIAAIVCHAVCSMAVAENHQNNGRRTVQRNPNHFHRPIQFSTPGCGVKCRVNCFLAHFFLLNFANKTKTNIKFFGRDLQVTVIKGYV